MHDIRDQTWINAILGASPDGALFVDSDGKITHANEELENLFGWTKSELLGKPVEILLPERLHATHPAQVAGFMREPRAVAIGVRDNLFGRRKDGTELAVEVGLNPIILDDRILILGLVRDISPRIEAEERLSSIIEAAPTAMILVNRENVISLVNSQTEETFGYSREEMIGEVVEILLPHRFRESHSRQAAEFFSSAQRREMGDGRELSALRKNANEFPVEVALSPVQLGKELFVLASLVDISERKRLERGFAVAREIQQSLLPQESPKLAGFDIAGRCSPAEATGGDFFDYIGLPDGRLALVVGDASGHGFGPALLSTAASSYLRALARNQPDLGEVLRAVNDLLFDESPDAQFVTLFLGILDHQRGTIQYSGAGQEGFILNHEGNVKETMVSEGLPLGLERGCQYSLSEEIALEPNDMVLLITDGVHEAESPDGGLFGLESVFEVVQRHCQATSEEISAAVLDAVDDFGEGAPQADDITAVVARVRDL
ncbi:MAG: PAS domain S-box protein [Planctomycetota bacterium]|jgi:PAS domain S-box-containing protein|nr:PAS domain S-box protein [Planctomycetota bacterium]